MKEVENKELLVHVIFTAAAFVFLSRAIMVLLKSRFEKTAMSREIEVETNTVSIKRWRYAGELHYVVIERVIQKLKTERSRAPEPLTRQR